MAEFDCILGRQPLYQAARKPAVEAIAAPACAFHIDLECRRVELQARLVMIVCALCSQGQNDTFRSSAKKEIRQILIAGQP